MANNWRAKLALAVGPFSIGSCATPQGSEEVAPTPVVEEQDTQVVIPVATLENSLKMLDTLAERIKRGQEEGIITILAVPGRSTGSVSGFLSQVDFLKSLMKDGQWIEAAQVMADLQRSISASGASDMQVYRGIGASIKGLRRGIDARAMRDRQSSKFDLLLIDETRVILKVAPVAESLATLDGIIAQMQRLHAEGKITTPFPPNADLRLGSRTSEGDGYESFMIAAREARAAMLAGDYATARDNLSLVYPYMCPRPTESGRWNDIDREITLPLCKVTDAMQMRALEQEALQKLSTGVGR